MANETSHGVYQCLSLFPLDMPTSHLIAWAFFTALLAVSTVTANSLLIYALYKSNQLVSITNKFVLVMNLSDLCTGFIALPFIVALIISKSSRRSCAAERAAQCVALFFAYVSFFMLMAVSVDRYIHVTKLNRYDVFMNDFRMKTVMFLTIIASAASSYLTIAVPSFVMQVVLNIADLACVFFMLSMYRMVSRKIGVHTERLQKIIRSQGVSKADKEAKRELSATKTIRLLLFSLLILYLPYNIVTAVWTYYKYTLHKDPALWLNVMLYWSYLLVFSNTAVNAVIYAYGNTVLKRFILNIFRKEQELLQTSTAVTRPTDKS